MHAKICKGKISIFKVAFEEDPLAGTSEEHAITLDADITDVQFAIFFEPLYPT